MRATKEMVATQKKEWLPAYMTADRQEAEEIVTMVKGRRKPDGTFFTGRD